MASFTMQLPAKGGAKKSKQYGLILPAKPDAFNAFAAATADADADSESAGDAERRRRVAQDAARSVRAEEVARAHAQALAQDASAFEYDGVYDELTSERRDAAARRRATREAEKQQPKYIANLLQKAKIREIESERLRERRLLRERRADDALYADKEKLVSASYKRKLQEQRQWEAEDARLDALEDAEDVTKRGELALAGFYANLRSKNLAMGGSTAHATSAYTVRDSGADAADALEPHAQEKKRRRRDDDETGDTGGDELKSTRPASERSASPLPPPKSSTAESVKEPEVPKPSKEEVISAAKARFLARKAQREQAGGSSHP